METRVKRLLIGIALILSAPIEAAPLVNGGFETGDLTGWSSGPTREPGSPRGGGATALSNLAVPAVDPAHGSYMAMLSNGGRNVGTENVNFGLPLGATNSGGVFPIPVVTSGTGPFAELLHSYPPCCVGSVLGLVATYSELWQTFSVNGPVKLSFDWNFLSNELVGGTDGAFVSINENPVELLATAGFALGHPLSVTDQANGQYSGQTGWNTSQFLLPSAGDYTLTFIVTNGADILLSSALLVDDVQATAATEPEIPLLVLTALGAMLSVSRRVRWSNEDIGGLS